MATHRIQDFGGTAEHAWSRSAYLHKVLADRFTRYPLSHVRDRNPGIKDGDHIPIEHGVERRDFIDPHRLHFEQLRHIVHDADARPSLVLSLPEVEEGDDSRLLVLRWVMRDDFIGVFQVLRCKLERNLDDEKVRQSENTDTIYEDTPGLLYGLSLCCNVVRDQTLKDGARDKPQRERRSAEAKTWKCGAQEQLDGQLRRV